MKKAAFILALAMLLGVAAGCGESNGEASVQSVSMICGLGSAGLTDRFAGVVSALGETNIKKDDSLTIGEIKVKVGDAVNVGDVLFTYDMSRLQLDLEAAQLELESLKSQLADKEDEKEQAETALNSTVDDAERNRTLLQIRQINLEIHPMSFMDEYSTDEYSSRATGAILYIASNDDNPDHLLKFISNIYAEDFQPGEASEYKSVKNKALKQQAIDAGVPQSVADKAFNGEYRKWMDAINLYTPKRPELWQVSGSNKGVMSTPTITINGNYWDRNQLSLAGMNNKTGIIASLGLKENEVGQKGTMPSIGESGKPISLTTGE